MPDPRSITKHETLVFVGCFTASMNGVGNGISVRRVSHTGRLSAEIESTELDCPSFLVVTGDWLVAVSESLGMVSSFSRNGAELERRSTVPTGGSGPCHVVYDRQGRRLLISNYESGSWSIVPFSEDGHLGDARVHPSPRGSGPVHDRQSTPHAHQTIPSDAANHWLVSDLGIDRVLEYSVESDGAASLKAVHPLPAGTGPRHMAWAHGALIVVGELDSRLHILKRQGERFQHLQAAPTFEAGTASAGISNPSHLTVSADQRFVYVANRGRDTISVFDASELSSRGRVELIQEADCGGNWPRHFDFHRTRLYVANQGSNNIAVFHVDERTGMIGELVQSETTGSPSCLVFASAGTFGSASNAFERRGLETTVKLYYDSCT